MWAGQGQHLFPAARNVAVGGGEPTALSREDLAYVPRARAKKPSFLKKVGKFLARNLGGVLGGILGSTLGVWSGLATMAGLHYGRKVAKFVGLPKTERFLKKAFWGMLVAGSMRTAMRFRRIGKAWTGQSGPIWQTTLGPMQLPSVFVSTPRELIGLRALPKAGAGVAAAAAAATAT